MSVQYSAVKWNRNKRVYDLVLTGGILAYLGLFFLVGRLVWPGSDEILLIRALGTCAFLLLHVVLCIGPLARLDRRFLPLLYNRRHLGVATFLVALLHGALVTGYYHGFGNVNPLLSLLGTNTNYTSLTTFPFETLGIIALLMLFVMAATSHDFWQKNLSPSVWKGLHMLVYPAYALLVVHVALGALHSEESTVYLVILVAGVALVLGLHLGAAFTERRADRARPSGHIDTNGETWIDVCSVDEIPNKRAKVVCLAGCERIAIFRYDGKISAVTNVCAHQRGPLGEGKIVDGCITCPWHGWEYRPHDGQSPPPFQERIATYRVRVADSRVQVNPHPLPPGTPVEPALIEEEAHVA
ncbi:MAG: ferric reductase-like transmembrane domain-containing protein [Gemmataceae bacterium]|nr:ferric reductase-like transmembrane domain-containing protein [Gemmataceae bacterium]